MYHFRNILFCAIASFLVAPLSAQSTRPTLKPGNTPEEIAKNRTWRVQQSQLGGVYIPIDILDAFKELDKKLEPDVKAKLVALKEDDVEQKVSGLGLWMCQNWGFYDGSRFSEYLKQTGVTYPEDMARMTIVSYHRQCNKKDIGLRELAQKYKDIRRKKYEEHLKKATVIQDNVKKPKH
jgi:hypothetical protein